MANITDVKLSAKKSTGSGNNWDICVDYIATFSRVEWQTANYTFRDCFQLWEADPIWDDELTGWVACSNFNPAAASVKRTLCRKISADTLDTEWGKEEIYAKVRLLNVDLTIAYYKNSPQLKINP